MKKLLLFVTMAASLLFTQCRKEESVSSAGKTVRMTVTAGPGSKTDITDAGAITWSMGDKLYVGDGTQYIGYLTLVGEGGSATGTFTGNVELTGVEEGDELTFHFYYLGSADHTDLAKNATSVDVDFSSQDITKGTDGKLTNASKQHVGYGSATGTVINDVVTDINVMLVSKVAIARFSFTNDSQPYTGALTLSGDNIYNEMTVNFNSTEFACEGTEGEISLTNTTSSEKYVMLVPTSETTGEQTLTFADANVSGSYTLANGIEANKFYGLTGAIEVTLEAAAPAHETVNMGLPSPYDKLEWATCNVGASKPEESGWYFMWGSTTNGGDSNCSWANCPGNGGNSSYNASAFNTWKSSNLTNNVLEPEVDAAHANWGGDWRMPTAAEWQALYDGTTSTWTYNYNGTGAKGLVFTSKDGKGTTLFLPASGYRSGTNIVVTFGGFYWSSLLYDSTNAHYMYLDSAQVNPQDNGGRLNGRNVRPVRVAR